MNDELDPERLKRLLDATARLPRSVEPERDAWPAIRDRIEAQRVRPIAAGAAAAPRRRTEWLAAAALMLVVASAGVTALLLPSLRGKAAVAVRVPVAPPAVAAESTVVAAPERTHQAPGAPPRTLPVTRAPIADVFARYDGAAEDLARALAERRARLDPVTISVLDSCLTRIDAAIAEAAAALARDPRNSVVSDLLTVSYRQKLDLLKRAVDLPLRGL